MSDRTASDATGVAATPPTGPGHFVFTDGVGTWVLDNPPGAVSTDPVQTSAQTNYGVTAEFHSVPVDNIPDAAKEFPSLDKLTDKSDRFLSNITDKSGRATLTVFDINAKNMLYKSKEFLAVSVSVGKAESFGIVKNNLGFTLYAPDSNPDSISLQGILLNGDDRGATKSNGEITQTDWFTKLLVDYEVQFKASQSINESQRVFFSFEDFFAEVFIVGANVNRGADRQNVAAFDMQMIIKRVKFTNHDAVDTTPAASPTALASAGSEVTDKNANSFPSVSVIQTIEPSPAPPIFPGSPPPIWARATQIADTLNSCIQGNDPGNLLAVKQ